MTTEKCGVCQHPINEHTWGVLRVEHGPVCPTKKPEPLASKEVSLYDVLIEAESYFRQQAKTFAGYRDEAWWSGLATAAAAQAAKALSGVETEEEPAAYILTVKRTNPTIECVEYATLPNFRLAIDETVIRSVPLYRRAEKATGQRHMDEVVPAPVLPKELIDAGKRAFGRPSEKTNYPCMADQKRPCTNPAACDAAQRCLSDPRNDCRCVRQDGRTQFNINCPEHGKAP